MNANTLISNVILHVDHTDSTDADNAARRVELLFYAQQVGEELANAYDWDWMYDTTTLTVASGATNTTLPTNFLQVGAKGSCIQTTGLAHGKRLREVSPIIVQQLQQSTQTFRIHDVFSVFDTNDNIATQLFQVATCSGSTAFNLTYRKATPSLVDTNDTDSNLQQFPAHYHHTVIYPGTAFRAAVASGKDDIARVFEGQYVRGLQNAVRAENQRSSVRQLGRSTVGGW